MDQHVSDCGDIRHQTVLHCMADLVTFSNADSRIDFNMDVHEVLQSGLADVQFVNAMYPRYGKRHATDICQELGTRLPVHQFLQAAPKQTPAGKENNASNDQGSDVVHYVPVGTGTECYRQSEQDDQRAEHVESLVQADASTALEPVDRPTKIEYRKSHSFSTTLTRAMINV